MPYFWNGSKLMINSCYFTDKCPVVLRYINWLIHSIFHDVSSSNSRPALLLRNSTTKICCVMFIDIFVGGFNNNYCLFSDVTFLRVWERDPYKIRK